MMNKKRKDRVKRKKLARKAWLIKQRQTYKGARKMIAGMEYAIFSKIPGGKWRLEFTSAHEQCRDSCFRILELRTDIEVRRVNV
tara:strand:- start:4069 stop:4320 length:252 start_codon:yes stop_codon:yes gene_type:complete